MFVDAGTQIVGTRWVLSWKDAARSVAKARPVVQGCQEAGNEYDKTRRLDRETLSSRPSTMSPRRDGSFAGLTLRVLIHNPVSLAR